ncbi:MAG TPA: hypothetical protein VLA48_02530 [Nitrososphaeraceae archaeon]|nr:hypothetical protein [Nitrososphaeraceae archaeon]
MSKYTIEEVIRTFNSGEVKTTFYVYEKVNLFWRKYVKNRHTGQIQGYSSLEAAKLEVRDREKHDKDLTEQKVKKEKIIKHTN